MADGGGAGCRIADSDSLRSRLLGQNRVSFVRVSLNSESKLLCPHGDGGHGFHNDRYS